MTTKNLVLVLFLSCNYCWLLGQEKANGDNKPPARDGKVRNDGSAPSGSLNSELMEQTESFNKEEIIKEIKVQLATMATKQLMELITFCKKNEIEGEFVVDLTLERKGKVLTVFMVSGGDNVAKKNLLRNKLAELKFENVKIPKKERVKLRYTLKF